MNEKKCNGCDETKALSEFYRMKESEDGRQYICKSCMSKYHKIRHINNRESINARSRKWRLEYPEKMRNASKKWYNRTKNKITECLYSRINQCLNDIIKRNEIWEVLGYKYEDFVKHIENQFHEDMTWGNHGEWEIDHIIPISFFYFQSTKDVEFKMCWRLENIQPMWKHEHKVKSNKIIVA